MSEVVVCDLSQFGYRELGLAAELLKAYADHGADFLGDGIKICFNTQSGYVFLSDEDCNVAMINGDRLEQFFSCPNCGNEGFKEEHGFDESSHLCKDCETERG